MRQVRRLLSAVLVLLGAIIIVPAFGGTASAHHSNIDASVACNGTVSWTATSWATGPAGTNPDIRVFKTVGNTTTQIAQGAFNNANNYQFSGTFAWPAEHHQPHRHIDAVRHVGQRHRVSGRKLDDDHQADQLPRPAGRQQGGVVHQHLAGQR